MTRDRKPGDVAVDAAGHKWFAVKASRIQNICWYGETGDAVGGSWPSLRPVVVIDPEDREQVERLRAVLNDEIPTYVGHSAVGRALLKLLAPEKPAEPQGLGAVVEDADGALWVRSHTFPLTPWTLPGTSGCRQYADIAAVKVLSKGVTP